MKVLMITDNLIKGGKERKILELLRKLDPEPGIYVDLVILKDKIEYSLIGELKNIHLIVFKRRIKKDPGIYFKLWKLCKSKKYDIVHSWGAMPSIYVSTICYFQKIPFINGMIANAFCKKFSKNWIRAKLTFPFSNKIVGNSMAGIISYATPRKKARVIYNGVHLDRFENLKSKEGVRDIYNIQSKFIVGMVGAFHPRKDYGTFIKAAINITNKRSDVCFLAIGDGKNFGQIKSLIEPRQGDKIRLLGTQDHVEQLINIFDIGVLLTNTKVHQEGISNAIIEYMGLGKPVIATAGGGTLELIENGVNGKLISPDNEDELIDAIEYYLKNEELRHKHGEMGRKIIEQKFTIELMTDSYIKLYKEQIN